MKKLNILLTGATGMIGEGILLECLQNDQVESVLCIQRKPLDVSHPKLKQLVLEDFLFIKNHASELIGYDACFYCAGKTSIGMQEEAYHHLTYDLTMAAADAMKASNPNLVFCFVSGGQTDSTEQGKVMWARVKGKTENALIRLFAKRSYNFRPVLMKPMPGQKQFFGYNYITHKVLYPLLSLFYPSCTLQQMAQAMIYCVQQGFSKQVLEVKDIKEASSNFKSS